MKNVVYIWTDGSCNNKTGVGAWAFVAVVDDKQIHQWFASYYDTTNNRMEMMAAIFALKWARECKPDYEVVLISDSKYLLGIPEWAKVWKQNGWKTANNKSVKNQDLVSLLLQEVKQANNYQSEWVHGHMGAQWNEHADQLASLATVEMTPIEDVRKEKCLYG